jgi:hypothetical protein
VAASGYREVHSGSGSVSASYQGAFERLEPDEVNISSPVLRGRRAGNGPLLPDQIKSRYEQLKGECLNHKILFG